MPRPCHALVSSLLLAASLLLVPVGCRCADAPALPVERVARVVDGDTLVLAGPAEEKIRLRGVNTPERGECGAEEARALLEALTVDGVRVERISTDRYGRSLAHLFTADGRHVQHELVAAGLAHVADYGTKDDRGAALVLAERAARERGLGLYGPKVACGTAAEVPAGLRIAELDANPDGDDRLDGAGESVLLVGPAGFDLSGWTLKDTSASHRLDFPVGTRLGPDGKLRVFTSCGVAREGAHFWCVKGSAVWNNGGDTAFLLEPGGRLVSFLEWGD